MGRDVIVTLRLAPELQRKIRLIAEENGVSQSAVWKILITRHIRPALARPLLDLAREPDADSPNAGTPPHP